MKMQGKMKKIGVNQIINFNENPRHDAGKDERDTLRKLFKAVGVQQMLNLAKDIYENGLLGNQQIVVVYSEEIRKYVVYEGNRRVACIKLLLNPDKFDFLDTPTLDVIKRITKDMKENVLSQIDCYITNEEEAMLIMERVHSGENKGRGVKKWSAKEKETFLVLMNKKKKCSYLIYQYTQNYFDGYDITTLIPFTTIQRIFNNREIKKKIGIDVDDESTFTKQRIKIIIEVSKKAVKEADKAGMSMTRLFNKARKIEDIILPWIDELLNKLPEVNNTTNNENKGVTTSEAEGNKTENNKTENKAAEGEENKAEKKASGSEGNRAERKGRETRNNVEQGNGGKGNLPYFFQGIQFANLDPNDPDTHGIAEVCKEIKVFSDRRYVETLPVAAAFLVRSIIEHSINYYSKKCKIQGQEKYIWEDIKNISKLNKKIEKYKHNLPNYITDEKMRSYFTNLFNDYEKTIDPLNWVVHRPEEYQLAPQYLIDLPRKGLLKLINFFIA